LLAFFLIEKFMVNLLALFEEMRLVSRVVDSHADVDVLERVVIALVSVD
jgi:hypothetical protein